MAKAGRKPKFTKDQVLAALTRSRGKMYLAADYMGCDYQTVLAYRNKYPEIQTLFDHFNERIVDTAEIAIESAISEKQPWAVMFTLARKGKERGWSEKHEFDTLNVDVTYTTRLPSKSLSAEEWSVENIPRDPKSLEG